MHATWSCHAPKASDDMDYLHSRQHLLYIPAWGPQLCYYFFWLPTFDVPYRQYRPLLPAPSDRRLVRGFNDSVSVGVLPLSLFPNGHVYFTQRLHEVSLPPVQFFQLLRCQLMP